MKSKALCLTLVSILLSAVGCQTDIGSGSGPVPGHKNVVDESWPGGSLGGWEDGEGVSEAWTRDEGVGGATVSGGDEAEGDAVADSDGVMGEPAPGDGLDSDESPNNGGGLEGGEIDDNDDFEQFLEYAERSLDQFGDDPMIQWLDIGRRHMIQVVDSRGATVPDALVAIFDGDELIAAGRSRANGRYAFFPRAYGSDSAQYNVEVSAEDHFGTADLTRP